MSSIEECPVCWRAFSSITVPFLIICGHSLCDDCSQGLSRCPICRRKLGQNYQRTRNWSLLSLVEKLETRPVVEKRNQEVQTESRRPSRKPKIDLLSQPPSLSSRKPTRKTVNFKLFRDQAGEVKAIQFKLC